MYQLTENPDIIRHVATGADIPRGNRLWPTEWLLSNTPDPLPPPYAPNTPAHHRAIRDAAWAWMSMVVQSRGYDSIESCCSYVTSAIPRYKAEALAMVAWRDAVNQKLEYLVLNPPSGVETWEEVRPLLPQAEAFNWPEKVELPLDKGELPIQLP